MPGLEPEASRIAAFIQTYFKTSNADRAEMGITVRDTSPSPSPAQTPRTLPLVLVDTGTRLQHSLRLVDESTPTRRARAADVLGAEVWVKLVAPPHADQPAPTNPAALGFLTMTTRPTFRAEFKPGQGGERWGAAFYMACWINTWGARGEGAVVGDRDRDGCGVKECREGCG